MYNYYFENIFFATSVDELFCIVDHLVMDMSLSEMEFLELWEIYLDIYDRFFAD